MSELMGGWKGNEVFGKDCGRGSVAVIVIEVLATEGKMWFAE